MKRRSRSRGLGEMTKRDFVAVAKAISTADASCRCQLARDIGRHAATSNPRFDMARFSKAAGCG